MTGENGGDQQGHSGSPPPPTVPADWYPDPDDPKTTQRYWDGERWTDETAPIPPEGPPVSSAAAPSAEAAAEPTTSPQPSSGAPSSGAQQPAQAATTPAVQAVAPTTDPVSQSSADGGTPAGWYTDPIDTSMRRYWDGNVWTDWTDRTYKAKASNNDPGNDTLVIVGWVTAVLFPIAGFVIGIVLGTRGDKRGIPILVVSIAIFAIFFLIGFAIGLSESEASVV